MMGIYVCLQATLGADTVAAFSTEVQNLLRSQQPNMQLFIGKLNKTVAIDKCK